MSNYIIVNGELYHHGIKGMKWGVRRYQNKDGSLTNAGKKRYAKELYKTVKNESKGSEAVAAIKGGLKQHITKEDRQRIHDKLKAFQSIKSSDHYEDEILDYAIKVGKEEYDKEMKRNGSAYPTERDKDRLMEYCIYDKGYTRAEKDHPEWYANDKAADAAYDAYRYELKSVADKLVGSYGNKKVKNLSTDWYKKTVRSVVEDALWDLSVKDLS